MEPAALKLLLTEPARVARWCGLTRLTDELHGAWLRELLLGQEDLTLLAHRGSYKTTCLSFAMAAMLLAYPQKNLLFMRKTDDDVVEVIRQVKRLLDTDALRYLSSLIYGRPVEVSRSDMFTVHTSCYAAMRGAPPLLGVGTGGSLTGKHADIVLTDDIVNLQDRVSSAERLRTRGVYQELQNIRNPGGRILNTGTPWHPEDAISLMPAPRRYDCWRTGLLDEEKIRRLQRSMTPSLFAANYELKHVAESGALFSTLPAETAEESLLYDGIAHLDAAYGGEDYTALSCGCIRDGRAYLYGRLWQSHVDNVLEEVLADCDRLRCGPIWCEVNGDKGYLARELKRRGVQVRTYSERMNKRVKIGAFLRKWWPKVVLVRGTDRSYLHQILDYTDDAAHDDAPDSAACLLRLLDRSDA